METENQPDLGPLFAKREEAPRLVSHAELDALARNVAGFEKTPQKYALRKGYVLNLLQTLADHEPRNPSIATNPNYSLQARLQNFLRVHDAAQQANDPESKEQLTQQSASALCGVTSYLHGVRESIVPRRNGYPPEKRMNKIHESGKHIAFMRRMLADYDTDRADPTSLRARTLDQFPHLAHEMDTVRLQLAQFDLTENVARALKKYIARNVPASQQSQQWLGNKESIGEAIRLALDNFKPNLKQNVRYQPEYLDALQTLSASRSVEDINHAYEYLRYKPCEFAEHAADKIDSAYRRDMKDHRRSGNELSPAAMDQCNFLRALATMRWALAADHIFRLTDRYFTTIQKPETHADRDAAHSFVDSLQQRRADRGHAKG